MVSSTAETAGHVYISSSLIFYLILLPRTSSTLRVTLYYLLLPYSHPVFSFFHWVWVGQVEAFYLSVFLAPRFGFSFHFSANIA